MRIKKIFLASSEELKDDRRAFELMLARLNQQWRQRELNFDLVVWENFIDAMSREGLQREYNKAVAESDVRGVPPGVRRPGWRVGPVDLHVLPQRLRAHRRPR